MHPYFVKRFNFSPECSVVAFTGDNPGKKPMGVTYMVI